MTLLALVYFTLGVLTASSYALFMDLADPRIAATQFSLFMAATNLCESWSVWTAGRLSGPFGYGTAYLLLSAVSLLAVPLLFTIRRAGPYPGQTGGEAIPGSTRLTDSDKLLNLQSSMRP